MHIVYFYAKKLSLSPFPYVTFMQICEHGLILHIFAAMFRLVTVYVSKKIAA